MTSRTDVIQPDSAVQTFNSLNAALQALKNGQIDGLVVDFPTAYYMANVQLSTGRSSESCRRRAGKEHFSMVLEKGSPLTACVNGALSALRADGTLAQIQDRWLTQAANAPDTAVAPRRRLPGSRDARAVATALASTVVVFTR